MNLISNLLVYTLYTALENDFQKCLVSNQFNHFHYKRHNTHQQEMSRFPRLHERIVGVVTNLLKRRLPITNQMVATLS